MKYHKERSGMLIDIHVAEGILQQTIWEAS